MADTLPAPIPSLGRDQVRSVDGWATHTLGIPGILLMENAGRGVAEVLLELEKSPPTLPVLIFCGPGNNGGDGFVIARHLSGRGWPVRVVLASEIAVYKGDARFHLDILQKCQIGIHDDSNMDLPAALAQTSWIVDALFGTGLTRPLEGYFADLVNTINQSGRPVLSVDLPSGLDGDTGLPLGPTVRARHTVAMVARRPGFDHPGSIEYTGTVHVTGIGLPAWSWSPNGPTLCKMTSGIGLPS